MNNKIKKWIKSKDELTRFEKAIINAHPERLIEAIAEGPKDRGKSMFCYKTMTRIFQYLNGIHVDDAYVIALNHFKFTIPEVMKAIDDIIDNTDYDNILEYDMKHQYRVMTIDDAGTHMGKYKFYIDVASIDEIQKKFDIIRDITSGLLMTTPTLSNLTTTFRDDPGMKTIEINYDKQGDTRYGRIVNIRHRRKKWARRGQLAYPPIKTSIWVDTWAYKEYKIRKRKAIKKMNDETKGSSSNDFNKMYKIVKKFNTKITKQELADKLGIQKEMMGNI